MLLLETVNIIIIECSKRNEILYAFSRKFNLTLGAALCSQQTFSNEFVCHCPFRYGVYIHFRSRILSCTSQPLSYTDTDTHTLSFAFFAFSISLYVHTIVSTCMWNTYTHFIAILWEWIWTKADQKPESFCFIRLNLQSWISQVILTVIHVIALSESHGITFGRFEFEYSLNCRHRKMNLSF